jgi:hypothetical protein
MKFPAIYAMSAAMYYGIEKPCITFGKRFCFEQKQRSASAA